MIPRRLYYTELQDLALLLDYIFSSFKILKKNTEQNDKINKTAKTDCENLYLNRFGYNYNLAFALGRDAFISLVKAMNLPLNSEILLPALGFKGSADLLKKAGFKIGFVDNLKHNLCPGSSELIKALSTKTSLFVPIHLFGYPCPIKNYINTCSKRKIALIEDCAHGPGIFINKKEAGNFGDAAFYSFNQLKMINAYLGGIAVTNSKSLSNNINTLNKSYKVLGDLEIIKSILITWIQNLVLKSPLYNIIARLFSLNFTNNLIFLLNRALFKENFSKISTIHPISANLIDNRLKTLNKRIDYRLKLAQIYDDALAIKNNYHQSDAINKSNGYYYVVKAKKEVKNIRKKFLSKGIDVGILNEVVDFLPENKNNFKNAWKMWRSIIQIPLNEKISSIQAEHIADVLKNFKNQNLIDGFVPTFKEL